MRLRDLLNRYSITRFNGVTVTTPKNNVPARPDPEVDRKSSPDLRKLGGVEYLLYWVVGCEDPSVGFDANRATFDLADSISAVGPAEEVLDAELSRAEVVEDDDVLRLVAIPPDVAVPGTDRLIVIVAVAKGRAALTCTRLAE